VEMESGQNLCFTIGSAKGNESFPRHGPHRIYSSLARGLRVVRHTVVLAQQGAGTR
jgi:hypothetical protein